MSIIVNQPKHIPHTIKVVEAKDVPYATKELLETLLKNPEVGIKRKKYYMINTLAELRGYSKHTKQFQIFEKFIRLARIRGASLVMIKFPNNV